MNHSSYINRCLVLAEQGRGATGINPLVGSILVREEKIIAESYHSAFGAQHAERGLIKKVEQDICLDDVLYVNLEPCIHHGKTPPCTQAIIESGIKTVVYGMQDPNPAVAGKGIAALQDAGITVIGPVDSAVCRRFNRGFVSLQEQGRPWITVKKAQTKEGRVADDDGSRLCITSDQQNTWSHQYLRATHDAILVGVQTVVTDNPLLTVRLPADRSAKHKGPNTKLDQLNPLRIVLDPDCRIPINAQILTQGTCIVIAEDATVPAEIQQSGAWIIRIPCLNNQFDLSALFTALKTPSDSFYGITSILVEGGPKTWNSFTKANVVDEEIVLVG